MYSYYYCCPVKQVILGVNKPCHSSDAYFTGTMPKYYHYYLQVNEESTRFLRDEGKQVLTFKIPLSHSGAAGLGISVKGKMDGDSPQDKGIFVKSVIAGGAAQKVSNVAHLRPMYMLNNNNPTC